MSKNGILDKAKNQYRTILTVMNRYLLILCYLLHSWYICGRSI